MKIIAKNKKNKNNTSRVISWPDSPLISPEQNDLFSAQGAEFAPLGNHSKSTPVFGPETDSETTRKALRNKRFKLLDVARNFAPKTHQIRFCMRNPGIGKDGKALEEVGVKKRDGKARWTDVSTCKSVSACPVCAPKIMSKKQQEVMIAVKENRKAGGCAALVTFTTRHKRNNNLKEEMEKWAKTLSRMKACRAYKKIKSDYGYIGSIRALENPHGVNGWHLHTHDGWIFEGKITKKQAKELEGRLFELWLKYCKKYGLGLPTKAHGVRVDYRESDRPEDDAIGAYITKMGSELTGGVHKRGKTGSVTYWQMLDELSEKWDLKKSRLVREHMEAMKGRALLYWSPGLKDRFNVNEIYEEEEAYRREKEGVNTDRVSVKAVEFYAVVRARKRSEVLEVMEEKGGGAASAYIADIYHRDRREFERIEKEKSKMRRDFEQSTEQHMEEIGISGRLLR